MVPLACRGSTILLRTAIVLELDLCAHLLCLGRIYICPCIGSAVECRSIVVCVDNAIAPGVAQIYACTGCNACVVVLAFVCKHLWKHLRRSSLAFSLGTESGSLRTTVGEGIGNTPANVGLLHVGYGLVLQRVCLVEKETCLPALELLIFLTRIGQHHTTMTTVSLQVIGSICHVVNILLAAAYPCALGSSDDIGPHVVLCHDGLLVSHLAVVPAARH